MSDVRYEGALTIVRGGDDGWDWWTVDKRDHENEEKLLQDGPHSMSLWCSSRISNADIEGPSSEMVGLANVILAGGEVEYRRCAVKVTGDEVRFWSPRNSTYAGVVSLAAARELAEEILAKLGQS